MVLLLEDTKLMNEGQAILSIQHLLVLLTIIPRIPRTFFKDRYPDQFLKNNFYVMSAIVSNTEHNLMSIFR